MVIGRGYEACNPPLYSTSILLGNQPYFFLVVIIFSMLQYWFASGLIRVFLILLKTPQASSVCLPIEPLGPFTITIGGIHCRAVAKVINNYMFDFISMNCHNEKFISVWSFCVEMFCYTCNEILQVLTQMLEPWSNHFWLNPVLITPPLVHLHLQIHVVAWATNVSKNWIRILS